MSSRSVILSIRSVQTLDAGEASPPVELRARGLLRREGEALILTYREGEDSGMEGVYTTLRATPEEIVLSREGPWQTRMVFRAGPPQEGRYDTPYGALPMRLHTRRLRFDLSETGGELDLEYLMELAGQSAGATHFQLTVREDPSGGSQTKENQ